MKLDPTGIETIKSVDLNKPFQKESLANYGTHRNQMNEIREMIVEMIDSVNGKEIPQIFGSQINQFISRWIGLFNQLDSYKFESDRSPEYQSRMSILNSIDLWHRNIAEGFIRESGNILVPYNFLQLYTWALSRKDELEKEKHEISETLFTLKERYDFDKQKALIDQVVGEVKDEAASAKNIVDELRLNAASQTFRQYADVFNAEALKYSNWNGAKGSKIGASEKWLITAILLTAAFGIFLSAIVVFDILAIDFTTQYWGSQLFTRVIIISIWIYLITFSFKQFTITRHLATVNRHRANALSSYNLFTESIDKTDTSSRNALMLQVAKAIYEPGATGYLSGNQQANTSIVELTRLVSQQEKIG
ncbi:MAG: hypothetical protein WDO14_21840 [Bacteroidota bacterium]